MKRQELEKLARVLEKAGWEIVTINLAPAEPLSNFPTGLVVQISQSAPKK